MVAPTETDSIATSLRSRLLLPVSNRQAWLASLRILLTADRIIQKVGDCAHRFNDAPLEEDSVLRQAKALHNCLLCRCFPTQSDRLLLNAANTLFSNEAMVENGLECAMEEIFKAVRMTICDAERPELPCYRILKPKYAWEEIEPSPNARIAKLMLWHLATRPGTAAVLKISEKMLR